MGIDSMDINTICDTDFEQRFEFHDAEDFRQDIYRTFGAFLGPQSN